MTRLQRRHFLADIGCMGLASTLAHPGRLMAQTLSPSPGPAGWLDGEWLDSPRGRNLPWRLRVPTEARTRGGAGAGSTRLIIFSHGLGGSRQGSAVWGDAWRDAGFMVLHLEHVGSNTALLQSGGLGALRAAASAEELVARVRDVQFALDEVARRAGRGDSVWGRVELNAMGMAGHSFGAQTVQALAGQFYGAAGSAVLEPRLQAFLAFSPNHGNERLAPEVAFGKIRSPLLCATGTLDGDPLNRERDVLTAVARRRMVYQGLPAGAKAELVLDGADHFTLGGNPTAQSARGRRAWRQPQRDERTIDTEAAHHAALAALSTDWWATHLRADSAARARLAAPRGLSAADIWRQG